MNNSIPQELLDLLKKEPEVEAYFNSLPPSHQVEYIKYINEAKKSETRLKRIENTIIMLREKIKED